MRRDDATLDEADIERLAREGELAAGYREAARRALAFAHRYRDEEGTAGGARERACIVQAQEWRRAVRDLRAGRPTPVLPESARPGLVRARPAAGVGDDTGRKTG
jgi:hypothetical protein